MSTNTTATFGNAIGKFISAKLLELSDQQHKFPQMCHEVPLEKGNGKTAYFYLYDRIPIPVAPLTEGVTPDETDMSNSQQSITVDEWGLYVTISTLAGLTIHHPVFNIAMERIADAIARVHDYTIQEAIFAGANKQYWDGTRANRGAITATDIFKKEVFAQANVTMSVAGSTPREGDVWTLITDPNVAMDIVNETNGGAFAGATSLHAHAGNTKPMEKGFVKEHLGFRIVKSNFMPVYKRRASDLTATAEAGGSLAAVQHFFKVVRRQTTDGFSDEISVEDSSIIPAANDRLKFVAPSTAGVVYDVYVGVATGDSNLYLAVQGLGPSGIAYVTVVPTSGVTAPATPAASVNVHVAAVFGKYAVDRVELSGGTQNGMMTPKGSSDSDPLDQRRKMGAKFVAKAGVRNTRDMLVIEIASAFL